MHISPGTTDAQDMQHTIEKTGVYFRTDAKASNRWNRQAGELQVCDGVAKECRNMACPVSVAVRHEFVTVALNQGSEHEAAVQGLDVDMTLFARFDRGFLESGVGKAGGVKCSDHPLAFDQLAGSVLPAAPATHAVRLPVVLSQDHWHSWPILCGPRDKLRN